MSTETINIFFFILVLCVILGGMLTNNIFGAKSFYKDKSYQSKPQPKVYQASSKAKTEDDAVWPTTIVVLTIVAVFLFFGGLIERNARAFEREMVEQENTRILPIPEAKDDKVFRRIKIPTPYLSAEETEEILAEEAAIDTIIKQVEEETAVLDFSSSSFIQLHAFADFDNALTAYKKWRQKFPEQVHFGIDETSANYKILVGPFIDNGDAKAFKQKFGLKGFIRNMEGISQLVDIDKLEESNV